MSMSHERVLAALELREPDRVPTMDVMEEYGNIYEILGKKPLPIGQLFKNKHTSQVIDKLAPWINRSRVMDLEMDSFSYHRTEAAVRMGYDAVWVMHVPIWRFRSSKAAVDIYGHLYDVAFDGRGNLATPMYREGLIKNLADWQSWDKADMFRLPGRANRTFRRIQQDFGQRIFIFGSFLYGLFENCWQSMGFERFVVATRRDPKLVRRMISFYEDHYCMMLQAWADAGLPGVIYTDDMGFRSGPMLNPKMYESLFGDSFRRITSTAHGLGMKIVIHSCGNVYRLLSWFADCGFDGVHALEPTAGMELHKVKEMVGDRLCLLGNMDIAHILVDADQAEVVQAVRDSVVAAGKGGGYIIAPTNSHQTMSVKRLRWMLEAVEEHGYYPLAED